MTKKESKNLGIAKACPECRKTIIRSGNFKGTGTFNIKCPHCMAFVDVEINPQTYMTLKKASILVVLGLLVGGFTLSIQHSAAKRWVASCRAFSYQEDAQNYYKAKKKYYYKLYVNKEGQVCTTRPHKNP